MNYLEINTLLEKYWECATTIEEERELRRFFSTAVIPPDLLPYKTWFVSGEAEGLLPLEKDFDEEVMKYIQQLKKRRRQQSLTRYVCIGSIIFTILLLFLCLRAFLF